MGGEGMNMEITEHFRWLKKQILRRHSRENWLTIGDFFEVVESLCVPQELEGEGWVKIVLFKGRLDYTKVGYTLTQFLGSGYWAVNDPDGKRVSDGLNFAKTVTEAQAWADAEIEEFEAAQKPKPFGPGTRLRAKNGDELVVVRIGGLSGGYMVINLTINDLAVDHRNTAILGDRENVLKALESIGATVIEGD